MYVSEPMIAVFFRGCGFAVLVGVAWHGGDGGAIECGVGYSSGAAAAAAASTAAAAAVVASFFWGGRMLRGPARVRVLGRA